jgi:hypothetical protein
MMLLLKTNTKKKIFFAPPKKTLYPTYFLSLLVTSAVIPQPCYRYFCFYGRTAFYARYPALLNDKISSNA